MNIRFITFLLFTAVTVNNIHPSYGADQNYQAMQEKIDGLSDKVTKLEAALVSASSEFIKSYLNPGHGDIDYPHEALQTKDLSVLMYKAFEYAGKTLHSLQKRTAGSMSDYTRELWKKVKDQSAEIDSLKAAVDVQKNHVNALTKHVTNLLAIVREDKKLGKAIAERDKIAVR